MYEIDTKVAVNDRAIHVVSAHAVVWSWRSRDPGSRPAVFGVHGERGSNMATASDPKRDAGHSL